MNMDINTYRGVVNDRPLDTMVVNHASGDNSPPANVSRPNFMDNVLGHMNSRGVVPVANVPKYIMGLAA
jgi:hypothetical protein